MSVCIQFTCDECGESESEELEVSIHMGGFTSVDLPYGWKVDPEDDERHLCEACANPTEFWAEPMAGHPNRARALPQWTGPGWGGWDGLGVPAYSYERCPCGLIHGKEER
jgi:hypothetical protein